MQVSTFEQEKKDGWVLKTPIDGLIAYLSIRFGGEKPKELERFMKFASVGILGAVIDFGTLNLLEATVLPPTQTINVALATTFAFIAAVTSNFIFNRYWTYPDSRSRSLGRQLAQFFAVSAVGLAARIVWVTLTYSAFGLFATGILHTLSPQYAASAETTKKLGTNVAQLIAVFVVMIWNFFINRYWTYSDVE